MDKTIVITSIFEPTQAVKTFAKFKDYNVVVVGDKKSPSKYVCENLSFLAWNKKLGYNIEKVLPFNHYCRKMLGYLYAMKNGANVIVDTDDDNIPYQDWKFPNFDGVFDIIDTESLFFNIYNYYTYKKIWPRGLPLNYINKKVEYTIKNKPLKIGVWQGLADKDPDVDAIYRLLDDTPCVFDKTKKNVALSQGTYCPFNTQNTAFRKELFVLMYLPATVTFRYTDILRGLVAQPIMNLYGYNLGFLTATVYQERNEHDYMKDFELETPMYLTAEKVVNLIDTVIDKNYSLEDNLLKAYTVLSENNIVKRQELTILNAWLEDFKNEL